MSYSLILTGIAMLCYVQSRAQKRWDGEGQDGRWNTAKNWTLDIAPTSTTDVLLDNSIITGDYTVILPGGNNAITVKSLTITPAAGRTIQCILPDTNNVNFQTAALTISGTGLVINSGGVFRNSGGGSGVETIAFSTTSDSLRINNGGRYWHNTSRAIGDIVKRVSKAAGTENGTFEIETPGGTGTTPIPLLLSRVFGNLIFTGPQSGTRTYTITGNTVTINGNLTIKAGVKVNVESDAGSNIIIKGNYIQNGGVLNLANNTSNNTFLMIAGDITQSATGQIARGSGPGFPFIELNGTTPQSISLAGTVAGGAITGQVELRMNNPAGITLLAPLSLAYKLRLLKGTITTSAVNLLTLKDTCILVIPADTTSSISFINGPLKKEGLSATSRFLFPVGKNNMHRWLELRNAYGSYTVEYIRSNPHDLCLVSQSGIDHISGVEYWKITADASPTPSAVVKLSFDNVNSGGITDLSALRAARLKSGATSWANLGNAGTAGTATTNGYITASNSVTDFDNLNGDFFTLATNNPSHPLPLKDPIQQSRQEAQKKVLFTKLLYTNPSILQGTTTLLTVLAEKEEPIRIALINKMGQPVRVLQFFLSKGNNKLMLDLSGLTSGIYQVTGYTADRSTNTIRCIKL